MKQKLKLKITKQKELRKELFQLFPSYEEIMISFFSLSSRSDLINLLSYLHSHRGGSHYLKKNLEQLVHLNDFTEKSSFPNIISKTVKEKKNNTFSEAVNVPHLLSLPLDRDFLITFNTEDAKRLVRLLKENVRLIIDYQYLQIDVKSYSEDRAQKYTIVANLKIYQYLELFPEIRREETELINYAMIHSMLDFSDDEMAPRGIYE